MKSKLICVLVFHIAITQIFCKVKGAISTINFYNDDPTCTNKTGYANFVQ